MIFPMRSHRQRNYAPNLPARMTSKNSRPSSKKLLKRTLKYLPNPNLKNRRRKRRRQK